MEILIKVSLEFSNFYSIELLLQIKDLNFIQFSLKLTERRIQTVFQISRGIFRGIISFRSEQSFTTGFSVSHDSFHKLAKHSKVDLDNKSKLRYFK